MYSNIGEKIKGLAKAIGIIGMVCGAIWLLASLINYTEYSDYIQYAYSYEYSFLYEKGLQAVAAKEGIKWSIITIAASLVSSWPMYGFGQLIENTDKLVAMHQNKPEKSASIEDELPLI